jgi:hypothetical protein
MPKISQLPTIEIITTGSIIPVVENSITQKLSVGKLFEFLSGALDETFATETELMLTASAGSVNTSSLVTTSSFNSYTSSNDGKWNTLGGQTGSFVTEAETSSFVTNVSMFLSKSIFDTYTGSAANAVSSAINAATSSLSSSNAALDNIQLFTASFNTFTSSVNSFSASVNGKTGSYATTGSNTFIGNQTISGSTYISGGLDITNNGYSWSFESNGRTKIPNITFNSDRGTGMVGIKPAIGREFQIETSTEVSSAGPWVFGLDGTLSAPSGANITRVANLITTSSFNTFTSSLSGVVSSSIQITNYGFATTSSLAVVTPFLSSSVFNTFATSSNTFTASVNTTTASLNSKTGSYATTGSNRFNGNQTITGSIIVSGSGSFIGNQRIIGSVVQGEGLGAGATGLYSYTHGYYVEARGEYSRAVGVTTLATGTGSHAEGSNGTAAGNMSHAEGNYTQANGAYSHAEGNNTQALGVGAHSEGNYTIAKGDHQHVQGQYNITSSAVAAFIIGNGTDFDNRSNLVFASGSQFQITGSLTVNGNQTITGSLIHGLEGNLATGDQSHAEGSITKAIGNYSHAEGDYTQAKGDYSHAEGQETIASGSYSHAEGYQTIALANHQHVQGQFNATSSVLAAFIVGNGTDDSNRSNLIHAAGNTVEITGSLNVGGGTITVAGVGGDEGGEILLGKATTNTTLTGSGVSIDIWQNRLRFFEQGGNARGAYLNVASQSNSVGSSIVTSPNLFSIQTITSASYAALTPVSGTLYIII